MRNIKKIGLGLALTLLLASCANKDTNTNGGSLSETEDVKTIRIGFVGEDNEVWEDVKERYEKESGNM